MWATENLSKEQKNNMHKNKFLAFKRSPKITMNNVSMNKIICHQSSNLPQIFSTCDLFRIPANYLPR